MIFPEMSETRMDEGGYVLMPPEGEAVDLTYIVPARNVENYIEDCLISIARDVGINQEIIVIDDRSTDDTLGVARRFAARHPDMRFVLTSTRDFEKYEMGGLGAARNVGIALATGRYLCFVDSDDWIEAHAFANLVALLDRHDVDFGWLRAVTYNQRSGEFAPFNDEAARNAVLNGRPTVMTNLKETPSLCRFEPSSCNRVYRSSFFRQKVGSFHIGLFYEDVPMHYRTLNVASRILITSMTGYYYRINRVGQITSRNDEKRFDYIQILNEVARDASQWPMSTAAAVEMLTYLMDFGTWCFFSIGFPLRQKFIDEFAVTLRRFPEAWTNHVLGRQFGNDKQSYRLWLILNGLARDLMLARADITVPRTSLRFYLDTGRTRYVQVAVKRRMRAVTAKYSRRFKLG